MDFIPLSALFLGAGALAIGYYRWVPSAEALRSRLPNRATPSSIVLTLVMGGAAWYILSTFSGFSAVSRMLMLIFALLFFESLFLIGLRWVRVNFIALILALAVTAALFWAQLQYPTFFGINTIIIMATMGAATLLIRLGYLRTPILFIVASLWTVYDIMLVEFVLPAVTRPSTNPVPSFLYPAVTVGQLSLGSGDFMFLTLFALIVMRDFGALAASILVAAEVVGLLMTGLLLPEQGFLVPFLVVMTPIFFLVYLLVYLVRRTSSETKSV